MPTSGKPGSLLGAKKKEMMLDEISSAVGMDPEGIR